jgi:hypothetical protein
MVAIQLEVCSKIQTMLCAQLIFSNCWSAVPHGDLVSTLLYQISVPTPALSPKPATFIGSAPAKSQVAGETGSVTTGCRPKDKLNLSFHRRHVRFEIRENKSVFSVAQESTWQPIRAGLKDPMDVGKVQLTFG